MVVEAAQAFTLPFPGTPERALEFVRDPAWALSDVGFLRHLSADQDGVRGELVVALPVLGEADLPFHSRLRLLPDGAALDPAPLSGERAWVEVQGTARVDGVTDVGAALAFSFVFRAHLSLPDGGGWGGEAFSKMVRAAAGRTLERVARELPAGIAQAMTRQPE
ncbi:hypothetical protein HNQ07_002989 [Deinococcus metalli]|uniref:DUF3809 domain-containing protein n=1 Tax=Deinococcus metalli TaxID=1141878 RepID=A0A7W8NST9_9DEIO|nr:DUF3809 domain-containing protein [Deinococcus metalli]MBB5377497.1 hypothetical protein [Deinococcus metalli]GHF50882.1 hypothetical protein GCM10017781_29260 [Deinococcus metalli]